MQILQLSIDSSNYPFSQATEYWAWSNTIELS